jgi:hypothetical protein
MPTYIPLRSFGFLLKLISKHLGDENVIIAGEKTNRSYDVGFYLYTGPEEKASPYHYLDPHKKLNEVIEDFYNNMKTPSGIFKECSVNLDIRENKIVAVWSGCTVVEELFQYISGIHAGMIKTSVDTGHLTSRLKDDAFVFEIESVY